MSSIAFDLGIPRDSDNDPAIEPEYGHDRNLGRAPDTDSDQDPAAEPDRNHDLNLGRAPDFDLDSDSEFDSVHEHTRLYCLFRDFILIQPSTALLILTASSISTTAWATATTTPTTAISAAPLIST